MPINHFNMIAGVYDRAATFLLSASLSEQLSLTSGSLILDAGGGTGRVGAALTGETRRVVVVDSALEMLRHAVRRNLSSVYAPLENLPFSSGLFDRIIMMDAFHHVFDQKKTASELLRVLKTGGRIVIVEPDIHRFRMKLLAMGEKLLLMRSHFLSGGQIAGLFEDRNVHVGVMIDGYNVFVLIEKVR
jgi:ubiquinone/menaquinone biosynthesis C-methylase UbiE